MVRNRQASSSGRATRGALVTSVILATASVPLAQAATPKDVFLAHPAVRYDPKDRCPDLRVSDEGDTATVVFMVNTYGAPSQASVRSPSGIAGLDEAAVACVMRLKFQPATRPGDAQPLDSWQQLGLRYAVGRTAAAPAPAAAVAPTPAAAAPPAVAATAAVAPAAAAAPAPAVHAASSQVHVCADAAGKLTQEPVVTRSSGDAALDAAAVRIARAGAANYHPAGTTGPGCAQITVSFEGR